MAENFYYYKQGGGITFIDPEDNDSRRHSYKDFNLILREARITLPKPQTNFMSIPFRDGTLDLTAPFGEEYVSYEDRFLYLTFTDLEYRQGFMSKFSRLAQSILGKRKKVILDKDPSYYYIGRCVEISDPETESDFGTSTVTFEVEPYRYSIYSADDPWLWDPFNFLTDMAIDAGSFTVNGTLTRIINVGENDVAPTITVDSEMTLEFEGKTYQLHPGTITNYDIWLKGNKQNILKFTGHGTVTIDYRGGRF